MLHGIVGLIGDKRRPGAAPGQAARTRRAGIARHALRTLRPLRTLDALHALRTGGTGLAAAEIDAVRPVGGRSAQLEEQQTEIGGEERETRRRVVVTAARGIGADCVRRKGLA